MRAFVFACFVPSMIAAATSWDVLTVIVVFTVALHREALL